MKNYPYLISIGIFVIVLYPTQTYTFFYNYASLNNIEYSEIFSSIESVKFYSLSKKSDSRAVTQTKIEDISTLDQAGLVKGKLIKIIVHGFASGVNTPHEPCRVLVPAYLKKDFDNLICVDWSLLAAANIPLPIDLLMYVKILKINVPRVGERIAKLIESLLNKNLIQDPTMVHLIGHSLGAHVAGAAGARVKQLIGKTVGRITGLDPAGPLINLVSDNVRLNPSDAMFVDVIHTDSGFLGSRRSFGHVDFFANGGKGEDQPGCSSPKLTFLRAADPGCGHKLSNSYYARTILGEVFKGCKCAKNRFRPSKTTCAKPVNVNCTETASFGEYASDTARGDYYLHVPAAQKTISA